MTELAAPTLPEALQLPRKWIVLGGRVLLALLLLLAWEIGARSLGPLFFAPPLGVLARIGELAQSGKLVTDIVATLRVRRSASSSAASAGVLLPFLLRRSARVTDAVEPYIMAIDGHSRNTR